MSYLKVNSKDSIVRDCQNGATLVLLSIAMLPLIALLALAVDGYSLLASDLEQHNNAEYSALSALRLALNPATNSVVTARIPQAIERAEQIAGSNRYLGNRNATQVLAHELRDKKAGIVTFGFWDRSTRIFIEGGNCLPDGAINANSVQVALKTQVGDSLRESSRLKAIFSTIFGYKRFDSQARAIAYWDQLRSLYSFAPPDAQITSRNLLDVNGDQRVDYQDSDLISNYINANGAGSVTDKLCLDTNNDQSIGPLDVVTVLNFINNR
jgi:hypothetical protein